MGANHGAESAYPTGAPEFNPGFQWGLCYSIFSFMCMFCRSLFVLLYFFFWSLCCLFFDLWILITSLVSSSSHFSYIKETYSVFAQNIVGIFSGGGKTKSKVDMPSIAACISHLDNLFNWNWIWKYINILYMYSPQNKNLSLLVQIKS